MAEFPALPFWTDAYLGDTRHLTTIEHGAYFLLLVAAWRTKTCDLPDDDEQLRRIAGLTAKQWERIGPVLRPFFSVRGNRIFSPRLNDERDAVRQKVNQRIQAGKASALKRKHRGSTTVEVSLQRNSTIHTQNHTHSHNHREEEETEPGDLFSKTQPNGPGGGAARVYAFEGKVIKLSAEHLEDWRRLYKHIPNLEAELDGLDRYYASGRGDLKYNGAGNPIWWDRTKNALSKKDADYARSTADVAQNKGTRWAI